MQFPTVSAHSGAQVPATIAGRRGSARYAVQKIQARWRSRSRLAEDGPPEQPGSEDSASVTACEQYGASKVESTERNSSSKSSWLPFATHCSDQVSQCSSRRSSLTDKASQSSSRISSLASRKSIEPLPIAPMTWHGHISEPDVRRAPHGLLYTGVSCLSVRYRHASRRKSTWRPPRGGSAQPVGVSPPSVRKHELETKSRALKSPFCILAVKSSARP